MRMIILNEDTGKMHPSWENVKGFVYVPKCQNHDCGFENRMYISKTLELDIKIPIVCVKCGSQVRYALIGWTHDTKWPE